jgi:N,N'-diacetyllegionaminate synthase
MSKDRVFIIAEAGVNHNGDLSLARRLIDVAAEAGADAVKFQLFKADSLATKSAGLAAYQAQQVSDGGQHEMLRRLELSREAHAELMDYARSKGIIFLSSPFDVDGIGFLAKLGLPLLKVPSGEIINLPYLRELARTGLPVILSTGMANMNEIGAAIEALEAAGLARARLTVLHCTTEYPTPLEEVNLQAMLTIRDKFNVRVGYSDHTPGVEVSILAVAMGAQVIEKHFTLDQTMEGPDHQASLSPQELHALVAGVRRAELIRGDGVKTPTPSEARNIPIVRKSIVTARPIRKGELLTADSLTTKRPGTGVSPMRWDQMVGRPAKRDYLADELLDDPT